MTTSNSHILNHVIKKEIILLENRKIDDDIKNENMTQIGDVVYL
jgi:hypothetical protein